MIAGRLGRPNSSVDLPASVRTIGALCRQCAVQHRHYRVVAQLVVVDQVLVNQRDPKHALLDQTRTVCSIRSASR